MRILLVRGLRSQGKMTPQNLNNMLITPNKNKTNKFNKNKSIV